MNIQERIATSLELIAHLMLEQHKSKKETKQPKRSGHLKCGVCGKHLQQAKWVSMFVCPDSNCVNSEEHLYD
jgi:uncharacterized CHY-type Zn-finger protein